jgi:hypothetical protein
LLFHYRQTHLLITKKLFVMPTNKKKELLPDQTKGATNTDDRERYENKITRNKPTAVNEGNPANLTGRVRNERELHVKNSVTGSDSDGQAD